MNTWNLFYEKLEGTEVKNQLNQTKQKFHLLSIIYWDVLMLSTKSLFNLLWWKGASYMSVPYKSFICLHLFLYFYFLQIRSEVRSGRAIREKQIVALVHFVPKLVTQVKDNWKSRLLQVWLVLSRSGQFFYFQQIMSVKSLFHEIIWFCSDSSLFLVIVLDI